MYEVDDLVRSYRMSLGSDPEYSGPAEDLFKSQKAKIEKQLKALEIIKKKMVNLYQIWVYDDYEKYKYEAKLQQINNETADIQRSDKNLELRLRQLDTEHNAVQVEMDAVKSVISKNVEATFKIFS